MLYIANKKIIMALVGRRGNSVNNQWRRYPRGTGPAGASPEIIREFFGIAFTIL